MLTSFRAFCLAFGFALSASIPAFAQQGGAPVAATLQAPPGRWVVLLHGGAGVLDRSMLTPEKDKAYRASLNRAVQAAAKVLNANGSAVNAVEAGLRVLEDDPLFHPSAQVGLEASIMDGATAKSATVIGVTRTTHPLWLAKAALLKSESRTLIGKDADAFAAKLGMPEAAVLPGSQAALAGSLGMVVRDRMGDLAAGTTTSGAAASDLPLLSEETYASNRSCAVASIGTGEAFLKLQVAHSICALVQYTGLDLRQAEDDVIQRQLTGMKAEGGVVAITADGQIAWSFNTSAMFRAQLVEGETERLGIFKNEP